MSEKRTNDIRRMRAYEAKGSDITIAGEMIHMRIFYKQPDVYKKILWKKEKKRKFYIVSCLQELLFLVFLFCFRVSQSISGVFL